MFRLLAVVFVAASCFARAATTDPVSHPVDFQRQVRPIVSDKCFLCHGPDKGTRMAGLRLDIPEGAFSARKNGTPIVPGKPDESLLVKRIYSNDPGFRMPPVFSHKALSDAEKETLRRWIEQGAQWKQHWAFVAPQKLALPEVKLTSWPRNPVDRFLLAKMEANGLGPTPEADRRTLIRRVTLDLTGLPPTPAEIDAFLKDKSLVAYDKVVDRLLASPHYGEQRAHYWLDAARYADTNGLHFDNYREVWPYRDWVIHAFDKNMPFDRFAVEQLAGDLLPNATLDQKIATGFARASETTDEGGVILPEVEANLAKDRADTTGAVFMGLTVGCATCHDHKFDPISQKDYYSLTSFFRNTTQPVMDLNVHNTPPTVCVPLAADRARWEQLNAQADSLGEQFSTARDEALKNIAGWLARAQPEIVSYMPDAQVLAIEPSNQALPAVAAVNSHQSFTISSWIFLRNSKDDWTIASQLESLPDTKDKDKDHKHRGWILRIDKGNLGIYPHAPTIYFYGGDGETISARPIPAVLFQPDRWYHVAIAYDGSGLARGINFYVDGALVPSVGRPEDAPHLAPEMASTTQISFLKDEKKDDEKQNEVKQSAEDTVRDFRILSKMASPRDVELLYLERLARDAARKSPEELSGSERHALATFYTSAFNPSTRNLMRQIRQIDAELYAIRSRSATTLVMQERTDTQPVAHVLYRGQYDQMREEVHPNTPPVLPPMTQSMPRNRLGLAMWIVDPANPLTARVAVNRFWEEIFGTGIVKTAEDFGSQGEPPSHPELLDWLAVDFRDSGWDVKRLFKLIVTSAAYRQSAVATPEKIERDPQNRLLARGPRFRMDAEMVRDYALAASGLLNPAIGGPSVKPYQPSHIWDTVAMEQSNTRIYQQDTGDKLYRRSLYTFWKRAAPPASMDIFNAPSRETCIVRRERTDSPLQALVTMNDVQFVEAARVLAQNAMNSDRRLPGELDYLSLRLLARPLDRKEAEILTRSYGDFLAYYAATPQDAAKLLKAGDSAAETSLSQPKSAALTMVANEMLNLDEAIEK